MSIHELDPPKTLHTQFGHRTLKRGQREWLLT